MRILIASERFHPGIGGVETVTRLLGEALVQAGHAVSVVTRESRGAPVASGLHVARRPGPTKLLRRYLAAQAVIVQGPAVRLGWPVIFRPRRTLVVHHIQPDSGEGPTSACVRRALFGRARHAAVSLAQAKQLPWPVAAVLPNPYDAEVFRLDPRVSRDRDVIFIGRLVPEKGARVLLEALAIVRRAGAAVSATIVGDGPERPALEEFAARCELRPSVRFDGEVSGAPLARLLNRHRVLVVPSLYEEPFGLVALEAIACGCFVIGSDAGGLPDVMGPCGATFPPGDALRLAVGIRQALRSSLAPAESPAARARHLAPHRPNAVARLYLEQLLD